MKRTKLIFIVLIISYFIIYSCKNNSKNDLQTVNTENSKYWITVDSVGTYTLFSTKVNYDDIKYKLQDSLSKLDEIPNEIPVNYIGEVLMGTRGALKDLIEEAINTAKVKKIAYSKSPEEMIIKFYNWYVKKINTGSYILIENKSDAEILLSQDLVDWFVNEKDMDYDYFIQGQDFDISWANVSNIKKLNKELPDRLAFEVTLGQATNDKNYIGVQKLEITLLIRNIGYQIDNIKTLE